LQHVLPNARLLAFYLNHMSDQLSELDWQELTDLITTAHLNESD